MHNVWESIHIDLMHLDQLYSLKELKRDIIEQEAIETRIIGILNTYTTAYNTVSRVVTLRMENISGRA